MTKTKKQIDKKIKCEDCFKKEDENKALKDGWKHYVDCGELKQDNWLCPECIPYNKAGI